MVKSDGSECRGCGNLESASKLCKKKHKIGFSNGCRDCGVPIRQDVLYDMIAPNEHKKGIVCEDYIPNPDYWQKDIYG